MAGGALDMIVARIESYAGQFLQTRMQLLDAKEKIDSALNTAGNSGTAQIGTKVFTLGQLQNLSNENMSLLNRNADLTAQIQDFRDKVAMAGEMIDTSTEYLYDFGPGLLGNSGMGAVQLAVPIGVLVATGAVLATGVYIFLGDVKSHVGSVAGEIGSNFIIYGGLTLLAFWYAKKKGYL